MRLLRFKYSKMYACLLSLVMAVMRLFLANIRKNT